MIYKHANSYYLAIDGSLIRLEQSILSEEDVKDCPCDKDNNIYNALLRFINKDDSGFYNEEKIEHALKTLGFHYIARDGDGSLCAYTSTPDYHIDYFVSRGVEDIILELHENWFTNIKKGEMKKL